MDKRLSPRQLYEIYKRWVINNPRLVIDVETVATWSSYVFAGKFNKSPVVSELVYSLSKLLSLFNDCIIQEANGLAPYHGFRGQIKLMLTIIHYCEVYVELVVKQKYGSRGKWTVATLLQLFKCCSALILLFKYKDMPIHHPPIPIHQRNTHYETKETDCKEQKSYYVLKSTGKVIRRVEASPPVSLRDWQPYKYDYTPTKPLVTNDIVLAESMYILKPIIHLGVMHMFGTNAWKQWLVALGIDLASMKLYNKNMDDLTYTQRLEVSRRKLGLVLYLLRSPMYNRYSMSIIQKTLTSLSKNVPLARLICDPLSQYLDSWQETYFYMWAL